MEVWEEKTVFTMTLRFIFLFFCVVIYTSVAKIMGGKTVGALAGIKSVAPNWIDVIVFFTVIHLQWEKEVSFI